MKKRTVTSPPLTEEEQKRNALTLIFEGAVQQAGAFLKPFSTEKYRTTIIVDHEGLGIKKTLVKEFLCFHFNLTFCKNKDGLHLIYLNHDEEAIKKFGTRVYNQMLRLLITLSSKEVTAINVEDRVRFAAEPSNVHNFFYKRIIDKTTDFISIQTVEL
jgi:hypothetical protein